MSVLVCVGAGYWSLSGADQTAGCFTDR